MNRLPHPVFAAIWFVWFGLVITALARPESHAFGLYVLLAFLPLEAVGVFWDTGKRDTLSEITTWVFVGKLSKHKRFGQGWNALLLLVVISIAYLLARTTLHYSGSWLLGAAFGILTMVWLDHHWRRPDVHG